MAASATDLLKKYRSLFSTTLSTGIGTGTGDTLTPATVTGLPTDTGITLTIDRVDSAGESLGSQVERITGVISGGNLTSYVRAIDNTTEQAHAGGAVIEMVWNAEDWNDMVDWGLVSHTQAGYLKQNAVVASMITASSITASKISASGVLPSNLAASSVLPGTIAASAVLPGNLAASSILAGNHAASSVLANNLAASSVLLGNLAASSVSAGNLNFTAGSVPQILVNGTAGAANTGAATASSITNATVGVTVATGATIGLHVSGAFFNTNSANNYFKIRRTTGSAADVGIETNIDTNAALVSTRRSVGLVGAETVAAGTHSYDVQFRTSAGTLYAENIIIVATATVT